MTTDLQEIAASVIERCREIAKITDLPGETTRTFLSPAMRLAMDQVRRWMEAAGFAVTVDSAGNLRGLYAAETEGAPLLVIGSHLDTVPNAGAFDGVLGVMIALALVEMLHGRRLGYAIELIAFSEEEGVRFGVPFIGSRALAGSVDADLLGRTDAYGVSVQTAIRGFGLRPEELPDAAFGSNTKGYLEFHIEQGPLLESKGLSLGVVEAIAGQTRGEMIFYGSANHAGTTPMHLRNDALTGASEWILCVEEAGRGMEGLVATVGRIQAVPGAGNVIPGQVHASLDVRHASDVVRHDAVRLLINKAMQIASLRGLRAEWHEAMDQRAVPMSAELTRMAQQAIDRAGLACLRMVSGAGHDAMVVAESVPSTMIFLRSPRGLSHHPEEDVLATDVADALLAGTEFLKLFEHSEGLLCKS